MLEALGVIHIGRAWSALILVALLAPAGLVGAQEAPAQAKRNGGDCLTVWASTSATGFEVFVYSDGMVGVSVTSPDPGNGVGFTVYVVPDRCVGALTHPLPVVSMPEPLDALVPAAPALP